MKSKSGDVCDEVWSTHQVRIERQSLHCIQGCSLAHNLMVADCQLSSTQTQEELVVSSCRTEPEPEERQGVETVWGKLSCVGGELELL